MLEEVEAEAGAEAARTRSSRGSLGSRQSTHSGHPGFPHTDGQANQVRLFGHNHQHPELDKEEYSVTQYYKTEGWAQAIARSELFSNATFTVIGLNAVFIGVDADQNKVENPADAEWPYQVCEQLFCAFFLLELLVRLLAFQNKVDSLRDGWFTFDGVLVAHMLLETWAVPAALAVAGGDVPSTGPLGLLRLLRLARMARLLRNVPELMTLVKGMRAATRAVGSTMLLLVLLIYTFAILMHALLKDEGPLMEHFGNLRVSMWTLLMTGTFMDSILERLNGIMDVQPFAVCVFLVFVLLSALTVMNMLIGVLCEVVSTVAVAEKEDAAIRLLKQDLLGTLLRWDGDGDGQISPAEVEEVLHCEHTKEVLGTLDVSMNHLQGVLFHEHDQISIGDVMEAILQSRGSNHVTVKELVMLEKRLSTQKCDAGTWDTAEPPLAFPAAEALQTKVAPPRDGISEGGPSEVPNRPPRAPEDMRPATPARDGAGGPSEVPSLPPSKLGSPGRCRSECCVSSELHELHLASGGDADDVVMSGLSLV